MSGLSRQDIEAIRKRAEAATEGRWFYVPIDGGPEFYIGDDGMEGVAECVFTEEDAAFISAAREDVPRLLAEVERLQDALENIEALSFFRGGYSDSEILDYAIWHADKAIKEDE